MTLLSRAPIVGLALFAVVVTSDAHAQASPIAWRAPTAVPSASNLPRAVFVRADCQPYWTRYQPVDTLLLPVVTLGVGNTEPQALQMARDLIPTQLATKVSSYVHGAIGIDDLKVDVRAFGSGWGGETLSAFCVVDGRWQVWLKTSVPVSLYWRRVTDADPRLRGIELIDYLREEMLRHPVPTTKSLLWKALLAPGAVERASGDGARGGFILGAVAAGGAIGIGGAVGSRIEAANARNEKTSQTRRDYYTQRSNAWSRAGQVGWMVAGAAYALGLWDALSINPEAVASWRISDRTSLTLGIRR